MNRQEDAIKFIESDIKIIKINIENCAKIETMTSIIQQLDNFAPK